MNLYNIAAHFGCNLTTDLIIHGVSIDSRQIQAGFLFVAIRGDRFDGHDFIVDAVSNGAVAVFCERFCDAIEGVPQLVVPDSLDALAKLAMLHRQSITCPVIALTGSNGKTSVKEMIAAILPKPSHATPGNLNNHIGAPLTVLQLSSDHRYAVFELGANHIGEIGHTVAMVQPRVTLINNIAPAHIEGFGSIEGVAKAKGEIHQGLGKDGIAVVNEDDHFAHFWDNLLLDKRVIRFSLDKPVDVYAKSVRFNDQGCANFILVSPLGDIDITLNVAGEHSVRNALAAASCCYAAGISLIDIANGLTAFQGVAGRLSFLSGKNHSVIIDDTYNANLRSVLTAVDVLAKRQGHRILVLGDMGELGEWTREHHEEIGRMARSQGIDLLLSYGKHSQFSSLAFGGKAKHYDNQQQLISELLVRLDKDTTVLVKGSRSAAMEKIVQELLSEIV